MSRFVKFPNFREPIPDDRPTTSLGQTVEITRCLRKKDRNRCIRWMQRVDAFSGWHPDYLPVEQTEPNEAREPSDKSKTYIHPEDKAHANYLEVYERLKQTLDLSPEAANTNALNEETKV